MKLAELCETSTSYIGQLEIGNRVPSLEMIEIIAQALQIKPNLLFWDESDQPVPKLPDFKPLMTDSQKEDLVQHLTLAIRQVVNKTV